MAERFERSVVTEPNRQILGVTALIVSSDDLFGHIVSHYLTAWGIESKRVSTRSEVWNVASEADPGEHRDWIALIDLDASIAEMAATSLCEMYGLEGIHVIEVGGDEGLPKPLRQSHLFDRIVEELGDLAVMKTTPLATVVVPTQMVERPRILVAEDNESLRKLLALQFDQLGVEAHFVADGAQAVAALAEERYAFVFMDCQMPEMDGYSATRTIRRGEVTSGEHIAIIAMTANAFKEDRDVCLAAGMDDYLAKPVRINVLRAAVERWSTSASSISAQNEA